MLLYDNILCVCALKQVLLSSSVQYCDQCNPRECRISVLYKHVENFVTEDLLLLAAQKVKYVKRCTTITEFVTHRNSILEFK